MGDGEPSSSSNQHFRRERSLWELLFATFLVAFLVGFVCVLCIGNYFRAKRAMERQRELRRRRLAQQHSNAGGTPLGEHHSGGSNATDSPRSLVSTEESTNNTEGNYSTNERKYLLGQQKHRQQHLPELPRRRGLNSVVSDSPTEDLLLFPDRDSASEKPKIMRV